MGKSQVHAQLTSSVWNVLDPLPCDEGEAMNDDMNAPQDLTSESATGSAEEETAVFPAEEISDEVDEVDS